MENYFLNNISKIKKTIIFNNKYLSHISKNFWIVLPILIYCKIFYPGIMSPDSEAIFSQAINHCYSDHHPPLMAYLWHYLLIFNRGPAPMFVLNMLMLWGSCISCFYLFKPKKIAYWFLVLPFLPQVAVYAGFVWKDIILTFGFASCASFLIYKTVKSKSISWQESIVFFLFLFYFSSVKFQAKFIAPIMVLWFFLTANNKDSLKVNLLKTAITSLIIIKGITTVNYLLVTNKGNGSSNAWQSVKLFDLSGMSYYLNQNIVPEILYKHDNVTIENIKNKYTAGESAWEPLVVERDSPFNLPKNQKEREILLTTWQSAIQENPLSYLKHRIVSWYKGLILTSTGYIYISQKLDKVRFIQENNLLKVLAYKLLPLAKLTAFVYILPFYLAAFLLALRNVKSKNKQKRNNAKIVLFLNSMGATLLGVLLFFTLAFVPRYIYFSYFMFLFSVPFLISCVFPVNEDKPALKLR